ncbi:helix-turn-helix transcriptional regulator [Ruania zhangjianzhongii]|uniref:helix-turn-helix transcriptional regulator n=1 Tax=Ruania zhangjianzhongii TaxID=2603206 RepID=UPI0011C8838A|nr:YafY family protein [Ruania zhangjianzhongii]
MLTTSARLLRLLSLLHTHRSWSSAELSERLAVSGRTIRADVGRLRELGYPVDARPGRSGGYRLAAGANLPPLLLEDEEAVAVAVGLRSAATGAVRGIEESSLQALAKLEQVLPRRLRHRVADLAGAVVPVPTTEPTVTVDVLTVIAAAAREHQRLRFDYTSHNDSVTRREVEPLSLVHTGARWYLVGWDIERSGWRTFRADRLDPKVPTGPRFIPREPPAENLADYVSAGTGAAIWEHQARIRLHAPAAEMTARVTPNIGTIAPIDAGHCEFRTGASSLDTLVVYLGLLGVDFDVLDPPELVDHVLALGVRYARAAGAAPEGP